MKKIKIQFQFILVIVIWFFVISGCKNKRFISEEQHEKNLFMQLEMNEETLKQLSLYGIFEGTKLKLEYFFLTDTKEKAEDMNEELREMGYRKNGLFIENGFWVITGWTQKIRMNKETINSWSWEMCELGYENDCKFDSWASFPGQNRVDIEKGLSGEEYFNRAMEYFHNEDYKKSEACFSKAIRKSPFIFPHIYFNRGNVRSILGNRLGAIEDFDRAIQMDPEYEDAYNCRGAVKESIEDNEGAIADYSIILEMNPGNSLAWFNRGNTYFNIGNKGKACADWIKAKELGEETARERLNTHCGD